MRFDVVHERDLPVPMLDGVELLADVWRPRRRPDAPTLLVRSPYGRRGAMGFLYGRLLAHYGFRVVVQSCRGTYGSGGELTLAAERDDGQATVEWMRSRPWFSGQFGTIGASYLGMVQWALTSAKPPPELKAMVVQIGPARARDFAYSGGAMNYANCLTWAQLMTAPGSRVDRLRRARERARAVHVAAGTLPLAESYLPATNGRRAQYFEDWLVHEAADDPWWAETDHSAALEQITVPVLLQGAWYDLYAYETAQQYQALRRRDVDARLTMYATTHVGLVREWRRVLPEAASWLHAVFAGADPADRGRVRVQLLASKEWRRFQDWPPEASAYRLYLQPRGGLAVTAPPDSPPDPYRYDPADPTPAVGGATISSKAGARDNRAHEARADVLTYTTPPLDGAVEVVGAISTDLWFSSSLAETDLFLRLCRVNREGNSTNVCDAIRRLRPGRPEHDTDGRRRVQLELPPTACRFERGERIRLQVSSGAHPRFLRNTGSGEPIATAVRLVAAEQAIHHDPDHPSSVLLHVVSRPAPAVR
jgi:putative CocE/NonD family hydrolase